MASQIAHIIYARKYLEKHPMPNNKADLFILGCVFPDIRRIDEKIERKDTHLCYANCDLDLSGLPAFQQGWKFHLYCDMRREEILNAYKFYSLPNTQGFGGQSTKMLEDEILYNKCENWEKLVDFFNNAPYPRINIGITAEAFSLWYAIIAKYIEKKPNSKTMKIFLSKLSTLPFKTKGIIESVDKLRKNEKVIKVLEKVAEKIV